MIKIEQAQKTQAAAITELIMEAMNHECCQNLAGEHHTLDDFRQMMIRLVEMEDSQYSFRNTFVAMSYSEQNTDKQKEALPHPNGYLVGIVVMYDGGMLHLLRSRFIEAAKVTFGIDYSNIPDETEAGELYIDSLCVAKEYRGKGIATMLINAAKGEAKRRGIPFIGLLVDKGNPGAEHLYHKVGFQYANDNTWGGHEMKHLQCSAE